MRLFGLIILTTLFIGCSSDDNEVKEIPECLQPIVEVIMEMNIQSPKANIEKYLYNNQEVYLVNGQNFPDGQSHVISLDCEDICVLGGLDGSDNDCPNWEDAELIETIWTDPR